MANQYVSILTQNGTEWDGSQKANFGMNKGTGKMWSDLDVGYLNWLVKEGPFSYVEKASWELTRRGLAVPARAKIKEGDFDSTLPTHEEPAPRPIPIEPEVAPPPYLSEDATDLEKEDFRWVELMSSDAKFGIHKEALNTASKSLLRDFITRLDKSVGIVDWLHEYAKEAIMKGELVQHPPVPLPSDPSDHILGSEYRCYKYGGNYFWIRKYVTAQLGTRVEFMGITIPDDIPF